MACVLVVDDEQDGADAVCRFLRRSGHEAVCFPNGREALAALHSANPDVVVLDVLMPEMDGFDFLKVLRLYRRGQTLPILVLTALPEGPDLERLRRLGINHILHKASYSLSELLACVNQLTVAAAGQPVTAEPVNGSNWIMDG